MAFKKIIYARVNQPDILAASKNAAQEPVSVSQSANLDVDAFLDGAALIRNPRN